MQNDHRLYVWMYIINIDADYDDYDGGNNINNNYDNKLHNILKLLYLHTGLYTLM
jgi:hypothetical protein